MDMGKEPLIHRLGSLSMNLGSPRGQGTANVVWHAVQDGRRLITFRSTETPSGTAVECDVHAKDPQQPVQTIGPYVFASGPEARSFGEDLMRALEYLGCDDGAPLDDYR